MMSKTGIQKHRRKHIDAAGSASAWLQTLALSLCLGVILAGNASAAGEPAQVFDTGEPASAPLNSVAMGIRAMWTEVASGETAHSFSGDAVLGNGILAVTVRQSGPGAEIYLESRSGCVLEAVLIPTVEGHDQPIQDIAIARNTPEEVALDVAFGKEEEPSVTLRFSLAKDADTLRTALVSGEGNLAVAAPCRYVVFPRSSGDHAVVEAGAMVEPETFLSGETYAAQLLGAGDTMVMNAWQDADAEITLHANGTGTDRMIERTEISLDAESPIETALMTRSRLWRARSPEEEGYADGVSMSWRWVIPAPWEAAAATTEPVGTGLRRLQEFQATRYKPGASRKSTPFVYLYDTGESSPAPLPNKSVASCRGWTEVPEEDTTHQFAGDVVLVNDRLGLVFRREAPALEVYARAGTATKRYAAVTPAGVGPAEKLKAVNIVRNTRDGAEIDALFEGRGGATMGVRCELAMGQVYMKLTPLEGATAVQIDAPCRYAVLPDFFADDIMIDTWELHVDALALPSENFLLEMLDKGKAILMSVWDTNDQDVQVTLEEYAGHRRITTAEIGLAKEGAVWLALLSAPGIWYDRQIALSEKGQEIPLDWQQPFPALWRVDWRRTDGLTDSWEMLTQRPDGEYTKHGIFEEKENSWTAQDWWGSGERTRIASGLGRFSYPCWVDRQGFGNLQPLQTKAWQHFRPLDSTPEFEGPALIYPLNRIMATPPEEFTVVDLVRTTLGVGPCEYILDVEGQQEQFEGLPTCAVREVMNEIYEKGQQKQKRDDVELLLKYVVDFITLIRNRIDAYVAFAEEMQTYLDNAKSQHPELASTIDSLVAATSRINAEVAPKRAEIRSIEEATQLAEAFRNELLDYEGNDALQRCKNYTEQWVGIGGSQDTLVAECRSCVKVLRQRAALLMATEPELAEVAEEVRERTRDILRNPVNYEAPRH